jgi:hypothetical protein
MVRDTSVDLGLLMPDLPGSAGVRVYIDRSDLFTGWLNVAEPVNYRPRTMRGLFHRHWRRFCRLCNTRGDGKL